MIIPGTYLPIFVVMGTVAAPQLPIGSAPAWALMLTLLVFCCAFLWLLTKPSGNR